MGSTLLVAVGAASAAAACGGIALEQVGNRRALRRGGPADLDGAVPAGGGAGTIAGVRGPHGPAEPLPVADRVRLGARRLVRRPSGSTVLFGACFALYVGIGALLVLRYGAIVGDAQSRVADGYYVFFSRDPHVAAIGFVWNPLPSVAAWPLFALRGVWPALTRQAFAGNIVSAAFMAATVVTLRGCLRDIGSGKVLTWVLVGSVALNPMVVYYGANGMSEASYLFFLVLAVRHLMRWTQTRALTPLVWAGVALALGYLARYEEAAAVIGATVVVFALTYRRAQGPSRSRASEAVAESLVVAIPPAAAFTAWAVISRIITGSAFAQFTSVYGNSSQIRVSGSALVGHTSGWPLPVFAGLQLLSFGVAVPLIALAAVVVARRDHDGRALAAVGVIASCLAFSYLAFLTNRAFGWLRFYLPVLLLGAICLALLVDAAKRPRAPGGAPRPVGAAVVIASLLAVSALPTTAWAMFDHRTGVGEEPQLRWVLHGVRTAGDRAQQQLYPSALAIARDLDRRDLPDGSVVMDTFSPCASMILMASDRPHQFVITSDRDFERTLADPAGFGASYLLDPPRGGYGDLDALNREYPDLYASGGGIARPVHEYAQVGCPRFRLLHVTTVAP